MATLDNAPAPARIATSSEMGHEYDGSNAGGLFKVMAALTVVVLISSIGVYQLFQTVVAESVDAARSTIPAPLEASRALDVELTTTFGVDAEAKTYRMPVAKAMDAILADPARFAPGAPPAGWVHPDDAGAAQ